MESPLSVMGKFLDPKAILAQLEVREGDIVADFGCGPGYFSLPFAKAVGSDGKVYALDVLPQAVEAVANKARFEGISNVITKRVNLENEQGSKMLAESFDWVILKDLLFQNKKKETIIKEIYRILKDDGRAVVVEWSQQDFTVGPEKEMRILPQDLKQMFQQEKFVIEKEINAGDFHYAFVVAKQKK